MYRLRCRHADRQIKQPCRPNQKTDACSLFSLSYLALCSPTSVFKATAGGATLSSAPWLLYKTSPVYLPSAGITLNTHLSHAARLGKSLLCLSGSITVCLHVCVCVNGTEGRRCHQENNCVCLCVFLSWGFHFLPVRLLSSVGVSYLASKAFYSS